MPKFSPESFSHLSTCHTDLQAIFFDVIRTVDCHVIEGYRSEEIKENGVTFTHKDLHILNGKHHQHPAMAVDVIPYPVDFDNIERLYWFSGYVMGIAQKLKEEGKITHSLRYGCDLFKNESVTTIADLVHFELAE